MEIDLAQTGIVYGAQHAPLRAQVCIVGAGLAGLVLADRLSSARIDVLILEAGGPVPQSAADGLVKQVELSGEPHLGTSLGRTRALGGSTLTWGGQLLPLPEYAVWPVAHTELEAHYAAIHQLLGVDSLSYLPEPFFSALAEPVPLPLQQVPRLKPRLSKFAPFGKRNLAATLGASLRSHSRVRVVLHAEVTELGANQAGDRVDALQVRTPAGALVRVEAQHVVLAAGTVETCRLLLLSRSQHPRGFGNAHDQVGRNFHDHLTVEVARLTGQARATAIRQFRPWLLGGLRGTVHALKLEAHPELRRKLGLNDALAHLVFEEPPGSGIAAIRDSLRARQQEAMVRTPASAGTLSRAARDLLHMQWEALAHGRRYISPQAGVSLRVNVAQQTPNRSRVTLHKDSDPTGRPQACLEWHHAPADLRSVRVMSSYLRKCAGLLGLAESDDVIWRDDVAPANAAGWLPGADRITEAELSAPIAGLEDARHAMGGAVMGTDPQQSVVDPQLRVHGVTNLWIASAAVFPDGAPQLPSLTLMSLTLRLAGQLERSLGR